MSELKVNKISPRSGTAITLGDSGDTFTIPSGATLAIAGSVTGFTSAGIDDNATSVAITIDSSERVGIGNTSPTGALDVKSGTQPQLKVATASATADRNAGFLVTLSNSATPGSRSAKLSLDSDGGDGSGTDNLTIIKTGNSGDATITNESNANIVFGTNNSESMRILSDGKVGIGTTSPAGVVGTDNVLEIAGASNPGLVINDTGQAEKYALHALATKFIMYYGSTTFFAYDASNSKLGIHTDNPLASLHVDTSNSGVTPNANADELFVEGSGNSGITIGSGTSGAGQLCFGDSGDNDIGAIAYLHDVNAMRFTTSGTEKVRIASNGMMGIGTTNPQQFLDISDNGPKIRLSDTSITNLHHIIASEANDLEISCDASGVDANSHIRFKVDGSEKVRIDSSGNLLVAQTATDQSVVGISLNSNGNITAARDGGISGLFNRKASDGAIVSFRGDGTEVGTINVRSDFAVYEFGSLGTGIGGTSSHAWLPMVSNARSDNTTSLGQASYRMTTIFATTGTINTSDQNEKQSIQSLTTAEMNVGKKLSSLIKTFKWNSSVEEKGDNARTHTGIIAQDVQQAFTDEGLDATKYGLWCSDTWSIDADGEKIENPEEETENNPSKTRLGIRYEQLLSFIQAYNDQRFTELEARITTLETNNP